MRDVGQIAVDSNDHTNEHSMRDVLQIADDSNEHTNENTTEFLVKLEHQTTIM